MKEKSSENFLNQLSAVENTLEKIDEKDEELYNFVKEKSEKLEPKAKELIKIYTDISRIAQREFNTEEVIDKKLLVERSKTFKDITAQIFEKLRSYLTTLPEEEAKNTENFLINLAEESEAIEKDAANIKVENKEGMEILNEAMVSVLYGLRNLAEDLYEANLYEKDNPDHNNLPEEIPKKISQIYKNKERKTNI
ncbi:MAG: hypothetical protein U5L76_05480 [Patescibacteria group bacterium]|nr:hypothetical protein [Patescibacteria group bacterium]